MRLEKVLGSVQDVLVVGSPHTIHCMCESTSGGTVRSMNLGAASGLAI